MSELFTCDDKAALVAYLYDELDAEARQRVDDHLRVCPSCAREVGGLTAVRQELATWVPPAAELGFTVVASDRAVSEPVVVRPARWWSQATLPVWAQAAAAVLVCAAGLSIANLQIRYGADGVVVTTGWMTPAPPAAARGVATASTAPATATAEAAEADWRPALAALESSLRQEMEAQRTAAVAAAASEPTARTGEVTASRVADLIAQSERRQRQELALRLTQFGRDLEVQRRTDLVRINQGFGQFEGRAGAEIARQRQMLDYIMRVSAPPPQ